MTDLLSPAECATMLQAVLDAILPEIDHLRTVLREEFAFDEARINRVTGLIIRYALARAHEAGARAAVDAGDQPATLH